ncbi:MAG: HAMP domain-containing sensor histidine kinase, partial [Syntrophales bacterium]|nr:HAMP domain-containing sensor histidine kinase [Syntrophales bacterium]
SDGQEGIRIARELHPAIAFVDLKMPSVSGMEVIEILSKDIEDIVLIVITGYASILSAVESLKKGAYDYIPKPFTPDQLRAVARRALEHRNLKIEAKKLKEEKEQIERNFITFVSHEMRSPLATIQQYMEALRVVSGDCLGTEAFDIVERCTKRIQNLEALVEHWLDLSRIENGTFAVDREPVDLHSVVEKAVDEMSHLCQIRGISVITNFPDVQPKIEGDKESLIRVLINIIGNATKYTPSGGTISIGISYDDHYVKLSVKDTGSGIPKEKLPFIFEPFYRAGGKEERQRGSGLGLTFCKRIMEAHGGAISVNSEEGRGTTFILTFPR